MTALRFHAGGGDIRYPRPPFRGAASTIVQNLNTENILDYFDLDVFSVAPEERPGTSDVSPCLESQGCHLIPLCYLLSCSPSSDTLSILSFSACWPFLLNFFQEILQYFLLRDRLFGMAPV